jgi:hypothetical protein
VSISNALSRNRCRAREYADCGDATSGRNDLYIRYIQQCIPASNEQVTSATKSDCCGLIPIGKNEVSSPPPQEEANAVGNAWFLVQE